MKLHFRILKISPPDRHGKKKKKKRAPVRSVKPICVGRSTQKEIDEHNAKVKAIQTFEYHRRHRKILFSLAEKERYYWNEY